MDRISPQADKVMGIMEALFLVFKESIDEMNEDKQYFLEKMKMHNEVAEAMGDYLRELNNAMNEGGGSKDEEPDPETTTRIVGGVQRAIQPLSIVIGRMQHSPLYARSKLQKQIRLLKTSLEGISRAIKRPPKPRFRVQRAKLRM